MRSGRVNLPNRCYHLISRVAHRAFFLDEGERTWLVGLIRRVARFSGVDVLAYSVMSNHFHLFVYIGYPEPLGDAEIVRRIAALYSDVRFELTLVPLEIYDWACAYGSWLFIFNVWWRGGIL